MATIRQLGLVFAIIALGFGTYWATQSPKRENIPASTVEKVRFAVPKAIITAPVLLAQSRGYLAESGLDVDYLDQYSSGKASFEAMLRGEADVSVVATTPVVMNSFSRDDFSIFATFTTSYHGVKIIARQDLGINRAEDLKGKTIGIVPGSISQLFLDSILAYNRILPQEVTTKSIDPPHAPALLKSGEIQAVSIWEPHAYNTIKTNEINAIAIPSSDVYRIAICLVSTNDFARKNPQALEKMLIALEKTTSFMNSHPEQAQAELGKLIHMDPEPVRRFWEETDFGLSLDQVLLMTMENEAAWLIAHQFKDNRPMPDFTKYINCIPLEKVEPQAVTIVRKKSYSSK